MGAPPFKLSDKVGKPASLVLITADFRSERGPLESLRGLATRAFGPVQGVAGDATRPVSDLFGSIGELWDIRGENERLREEVERLQERRLASEAVERENEELRALLGLEDEND